MKYLLIHVFFLLLPYYATAEDVYTGKIQPIFNNRCIACHSCYNAPCQLNLQDYTGFERGASKDLVYDGTRLKSLSPSRLWVDAFTVDGWRKKKFFSLNDSAQPEKNSFFQILANKKARVIPNEIVKESNVCASGNEEMKDFLKKSPEKGMPYGLPGLNRKELKTIKDWLTSGAPGPSADKQKELAFSAKAYSSDILKWEKFLNEKNKKHKLVARYIYEHLFLAHLHFPSASRPLFFRLIRTHVSCEKDGREINTVRPNENPGTKNFFYCFRPYPGTIVAKVHIPFALTPQKLERYQDIFFKQPWKVKKLPGYDNKVASNPFVAFKDIPVKGRYEFLLEDAHYMMNTFIKGPVCNGSAAVNVIQEHFFVAFVNPDSELMVISKRFEKEAENELALPGAFGSDVKLSEAPHLISELTSKRQSFRKLKVKWLKELRPKGYSLNDLWKGNGVHDPDAFLTVFRHDDNAVVLKGFYGEHPKTLFFLDYALLERLVYNLVVNFDVYGNIGHQALTRIYMDLIRMEAEEIFLSFLPPDQRPPLRNSWYQGTLTKLKMEYMFPNVGEDFPVSISFKNKKNAKEELIEMIKSRFMHTPPEKTQDEMTLLGLTTRKHEGDINFANFFPEISLIKVTGKNEKFFSLVRNREHENISWVLGEEYRLSPKEDTISVVPGIVGTYPSLMFEVPDVNLKAFVNTVKKIKSQKDFPVLIKKFGVSRKERKFWRLFDDMNSNYIKLDPLEGGHLDLTRYEL